ncbi:MAG: tRNA (N6-isopentenyl adenosine(37)-C2)-methylthiotransferase MiaB [Ruminococcaceae bacterium]|nr:tRNA (N6-isopentenyl adenosine(37)-C2)-methylthiotransferase MiaB [Oscillospiraceae bacterium]
MNDIKNCGISLSEQEKYAEKVRSLIKEKQEKSGRKLLCYITTFGCQQNEADSERLMGQAVSLGYEKTDDPESADLIIYNTCAVREHAELRALSRTGALKHLKEKNKDLIIGLWGCMVTQNHRMNDVKMSYPYVDFVAGTNMLPRLAEILCDVMVNDRRRYYVTEDVTSEITEGVPVLRENDIKAYVSIMYGCNNFCTYCVVPYVRGRERSRKKEFIIEEVKELVNSGYREITLLGQNVNSYGDKEYGFVDLLKDLCAINGDFTLRFMTSHPKDASDELIDLIAENKKLAKQFHLPMQSGSTEILRRMNRKYTAEKYIALAEKIKEKIPGVSLTTDIIVGFPGETEEDFLETYKAVEKLRFDSIFSFIYSPRKGTPAAQMEDPATKEEKTDRMSRLIALQTEISAEINKCFVGKTVSALCDTRKRLENGLYAAKTTGNKTVFFDFNGDINSVYGKNIDIKITRSTAAQLYGEYEK